MQSITVETELSQEARNTLISEITQSVLSGVNDLLKLSERRSIDSKEWLTTKEVQNLLKISNVTRWNWTNQGILKSYQAGNKSIRYKKDEVLAVLQERESKRA